MTIKRQTFAAGAGYSVAELLLASYRITADQTACHHCSRVYRETDYPSGGVCPGCRWPLPRPCMTSGCDGTWYSPDGYEEVPTCESCRRGAPARRVEGNIRSGIPEHVRAPAEAFWPERLTPLRRTLTAALRDWLEDGAGAWFLAYGGNGTGKTTATVRAAMAALRAGRHASVQYVTEQELHAAASERVRDDDLGESGRRLLAHCRAVDLLLVDEYRRESPAGWSDAQRRETERLLVHLADRRMATIVVSNHEPPPDGFLSELSAELTSRALGLAHGGRVWECPGVDLRRVGA